MKKVILGILYILLCQVSTAQENNKSFDFIISIDEEITKTLFNPMIIVKKNNDVLKKVNVNYYPGNLSIATKDYDMIFAEEKDILFLKFDYYEYSTEGKQKVYNYEIEIGNNWFEETFVILKIYNLDKKKYRKILEPLSKDKNYTFDLETSRGQMMRIRKN